MRNLTLQQFLQKLSSGCPNDVFTLIDYFRLGLLSVNGMTVNDVTKTIQEANHVKQHQDNCNQQ